MGRRLTAAFTVAFLLAVAGDARANPAPVYDYVTLKDGTEIAVSVWFPTETASKERWPTLFEMDGYGGARGVNDTQFAGKTKDFVVVYASVRGSGCSGGRFDLFSPQVAQDGHEIIEDWIVRQPWSNGRVGITGHSYSGLTGLAVAQTAPPHVRGVAVSGLMDDLYRGLLVTGGVPNVGFPIVWAGAARQASELQPNARDQLLDERCRRNFLQHEGSDYLPSVPTFLATYGEREATEGSFMIERGLTKRIGDVTAPTQIGHQFQDEQTGTRGGPVLWERLRPGLPKRLVLSNGRHNPNDPSGTKDEWLRCWVVRDGRDCGAVTDRQRRVLWHVDTRRTTGPERQVRQAPIATRDFPAETTDWRRLPLAARRYVSTGGDYRLTANTGLVFGETTNPLGATFGVDAPTQARWTFGFDRTTTVGGPLAMTLWATVTAPDVDLWVDVLDHDPRTGELRYLQHGMLRASLRRVDDARSDKVATGPERGAIWRPHYPFTDPEPVPVRRPVRYELEVHPLAHVFPAGHELVLQLHAPPPNDPLSIGTFAPETAPSLVQVLDDPRHRSSLLLPVLPRLPAGHRLAACAEVAGELCLVDAAGRARPGSVRSR